MKKSQTLEINVLVNFCFIEAKAFVFRSLGREKPETPEKTEFLKFKDL